jgi:uncharacterized protein (TIGR03067 family)
MLLAAAALLLDSAAAQEAQVSIEGTWQIVSLQDGGRTVPDEVIEDAQWLITGDKIVQKAGGQSMELSYVLGPSKSPNWIDLKADGRTMLGIYEMQGDTLTVCFSEARGAERSTAFESQPESVNDVLIVFRREGLR